MEVLHFLREVRPEIQGKILSRVESQIVKIQFFLGLEPGFRKLMESTPDGKKGRKELKQLLEELAINLVNKPNLVAKNIDILRVVS